MCHGDGLTMLVQRVLQTGDALLMKVIRNVSQWTLAAQSDEADRQSIRKPDYHQKGLWAQFIAPLMELAHPRCLAIRSERRVGVASSVLCEWRRALRAGVSERA